MNVKVVENGLRLLKLLPPENKPLEGAARPLLPSKIQLMKYLAKKFDSLSALSAFIANNKPSGYFNSYDLEELHSNSRAGVGSDQGTDDFKTANDLMIHGWHEEAKRISAAMIQRDNISNDRPRNYNSVVGFAPNVSNYLAGSPLNMINKKRVRVPARVVDIVYNCSVSCDVKAPRIEAAAATLFNVIAGLEKSGVRVNIWVMVASDGGGEYFCAAVKIKSANQPFNLLKMVYPVVHPSFLRRHLLALMERAGLDPECRWSGYGHPIIDPKKLSGCLTALNIKNQNILSFYEIEGKTEKEITEMIK